MSQFEPEPQEALARRQRRPAPQADRRLMPARGPDRGRRSFVARVLNQKLLLADLDDAQLRLRMTELQPLLRAGLTTVLVADCFALASEAASRSLGQRHHPGQVEAGWWLLRGRLVQMPAGDGKTLAISLAALTSAAAGWRVQVVCASEHLARRHAAAVAPLYRFFGLGVETAPPGDGHTGTAATPPGDGHISLAEPAPGTIRYTCPAQLATALADAAAQGAGTAETAGQADPAAPVDHSGPANPADAAQPAQPSDRAKPGRGSRRRLVLADDAGHSLQHPAVQALALRCQRRAAIDSDLPPELAPVASALQLKTAQVAAQRPCRRVLLPPLCLHGAPDKWRAVCQAAQDMALRQQRPVLVATDTAESAEALSAVLRGAGLRHALLDGLPGTEQGWLLDHAGGAGRITVGSAQAVAAGIDVALPGAVLNRGGLHVILAASTACPRLEQRVLGLAGRRGQPGSAQLITALDDDLFCQHATTAMRWLRLRGRPVGPLLLALLRGLARHRARRDPARRQAAWGPYQPADAGAQVGTQTTPQTTTLAATPAGPFRPPPPTPPAQPAAG